MKTFIHAKAIALLTIYLTYFLLSCTPERDNLSLSVETTIGNIQKRLANKDYSKNKVVNPLEHLKKDFKINFEKARELKLNSRNKLRTLNINQESPLFLKTGLSKNVSLEMETFGIDDNNTFNLAINNLVVQFSGSYSESLITTSVINMNNGLKQYAYTAGGMDQLLTDYVGNGTLSQYSNSILRSELEAISQASSSNEINDIINVVHEELVGSQLTGEELNIIYSCNLAAEAVTEYEQLSMNSYTDKYLLTGTAVAAVIFVAGAIAIILGLQYHINWLASVGALVAVGAAFYGLTYEDQ